MYSRNRLNVHLHRYPFFLSGISWQWARSLGSFNHGRAELLGRSWHVGARNTSTEQRSFPSRPLELLLEGVDHDRS
jgi:hypothetical protein